MAIKAHDLIVIGAGPGGYVAAIRAAQLGLNVACVEMESELGGTCLRVGCIPSKALLESSEKYHEAKELLGIHGIKTGKVSLDLKAMMQRKDEIVGGLTSGIAQLFKKNGITRYLGQARVTAPGRVQISHPDGNIEVSGAHIIIATGSKTSSLPGVEVDGKRVVTSTEALCFSSVPDHLAVIGAGVIGLEMGSVWLRLGAKVTALEYLPRILPGMDGALADEAYKIFKKQGFEFKLGAKVLGAKANEEGCVVEIEGAEPIRCDRVLVAAGRSPNTEGLGLEELGIQLDKKGFIPVDGDFRTAVTGIFAIGDVIGGAMLAHKAEEEGVACVEKLVTGYGRVNYDAIPNVVYTSPEIASVGKTEEALQNAGIEYKKGIFHFRANGRARALNDTSGWVKILADALTDRVLGVHIIGPRAGDLIAEAAAAMEFGASSEDIAHACHAHPTLSEVIKEAALAVDGRQIHS